MLKILGNPIGLCDRLSRRNFLQIGAFEAGQARNPGLVSWNEEGPVWGVPDGCVFRLVFNNAKAPFDDVELRRALSFAVDREQIVDIAYEGSVPKAVLPFSSYGGVLAYSEKLADLAGCERSGGPLAGSFGPRRGGVFDLSRGEKPHPGRLSQQRAKFVGDGLRGAGQPLLGGRVVP